MTIGHEVRLLVDETEDPDVIVLEYVDRSLGDVMAKDSLDRNIIQELAWDMLVLLAKVHEKGHVLTSGFKEGSRTS